MKTPKLRHPWWAVNYGAQGQTRLSYPLGRNDEVAAVLMTGCGCPKDDSRKVGPKK